MSRVTSRVAADNIRRTGLMWVGREPILDPSNHSSWIGICTGGGGWAPVWGTLLL